MSRSKLFAFTSLALVGSLIGCVDQEGTDLESEQIDDEQTSETDSELSSGDTYTPFTGASVASGPASTYRWQGYQTSYPSQNEDFRGYALPSTVECSSSKSTRSHLDVTAGCLTATPIGSYSRGKITATSAGAFRVVALPFASGQTSPMKWTDQHNEYRFYYTGSSGAGVDPGFKAFVRYRSEMDLYAASWRFDGNINIKKKQNGVYTTLASKSFPKPTTNTWHTMRFDAVGSRLDLYLDGTKVFSVTDSTFSWGTSGIRTDATNGAYIDSWSVK